jgi:ParB-like chromosome segregation protein Spo0J
VAQIAGSIREWGWTGGDDHRRARVGAGRAEARQAEVPVMVAAGWSDAQEREYVIADNKLALNAGWDENLLALEVADLGELGFELDLIGFSELELAGLLAEKSVKKRFDRFGNDASGAKNA